MNVLFLGTGNSARSIFAEALLNARAADRVRAFSAGSQPEGRVHPLALEILRTCNLPTAGLRSKSSGEFITDDAPRMECIISVCDRAAGTLSPVAGAPVLAHWSIPDPAAAAGKQREKLAAFAQCFTLLEKHINLLLNLPLEQLAPDELEAGLRFIPGNI
jgi:protein tyrosine phosphatase